MKPPIVDGEIQSNEWPGWSEARAIPLVSLAKQTTEVPPAGEGYALFDGKDLFLAVRVTAEGQPLLRQGGTWGPNGSGGVEVDLATVLRRRVGPAFVLHGYPSGKLESVTDGGVDAQQAKRFGAAVTFAARPLGAATWSAEFRIPLKAFAVKAEEPVELRFNLGLRQNGAPGGPWFAAVKTQGPNYLLTKAGVLKIDRTVPADAPNLLRNGDFEAEDNAPWRLASNSSDPLPKTALQHVRQGLRGDGCIQFHADDAEVMKRRVIKWTHPILGVAKASGRYCLSYDVRVVGQPLVPQQSIGSFNSYLHVQHEGKSGGNLGQRAFMLTSTGDRWIRRDLIVDVPENATPSMISLQLHQATGTVLVDNVSLLRCTE